MSGYLIAIVLEAIALSSAIEIVGNISTIMVKRIDLTV
jgi:hypothetical protein